MTRTGRTVRRRRSFAAGTGAAAVALAFAACGGGEGEITTQIDCERFEEFGDLQGTTVSVYTSIVEPEAVSHMASYEPFEGGFPPE